MFKVGDKLKYSRAYLEGVRRALKNPETRRVVAPDALRRLSQDAERRFVITQSAIEKSGLLSGERLWTVRNIHTGGMLRIGRGMDYLFELAE